MDDQQKKVLGILGGLAAIGTAVLIWPTRPRVPKGLPVGRKIRFMLGDRWVRCRVETPEPGGQSCTLLEETPWRSKGASLWFDPENPKHPHAMWR